METATLTIQPLSEGLELWEEGGIGLLGPHGVFVSGLRGRRVNSPKYVLFIYIYTYT